MTYLRSLPATLHDYALLPPRYGAVELVGHPPVDRAGSPVLGAIAFVARGGRALLRYARQRRELRLARRQLLELDDRLLRDMGLSRDDVRSGSFMTKGEL
jgi:uncharacterized protein YjiS (DUF1127 family)